MKVTLESRQRVEVCGGKTADAYHYRTEDGKELKFCMHPTKAWSWLIFPVSDPCTGKRQAQILEAFINRGFDQHNYAGGFDEAIQTLEIEA